MLRIELPEFRQLLQSRDDLFIYQKDQIDGSLAGLPDFTQATVAFDGQPATSCAMDVTTITCEDVPATVSEIEFSYTGPHLVALYIQFHDYECESAHPPCPN